MGEIWCSAECVGGNQRGKKIIAVLINVRAWRGSRPGRGTTGPLYPTAACVMTGCSLL